MNAIKKRKIKSFFKKYRPVIFGVGIFALLGLVAALIGFEIANDWHAVRKWLASPYATTFFICLGIGLVIVAVLIVTIINMRRGDD